MMHLCQTTTDFLLLQVRLNFNCPKPFLSTKCKLCIVSSYNYNIWPTQNEKQKKKLKGPRSIPQRLSVHYAFVDLQQRRQWCKDFKRQVLLDKKKLTTKDTLSRCHWMCFMSNKRDPLSEPLVPLALFLFWRIPPEGGGVLGAEHLSCRQVSLQTLYLSSLLVDGLTWGQAEGVRWRTAVGDSRL